MAIALFLLAGVLSILFNVRRAQSSQTQLAQLQDSQRMAMTLITDIVQSAGYYPDPTANTSVSALPSIVLSGATIAAGQALYGTYASADPGDSLTARFTTASSDTVINCVGGTNTTGTLVRYVNTFSVNSSGQLVCSLNGATATPLISGIKRMEVRWGVKRDLTTEDNDVDTYLWANELTAADWSNVSSVRVRLIFNNPLAAQPGQPATIQFTRIIAIMSRAGVKT
jgi:type IV pilus assembly protein PilW